MKIAIVGGGAAGLMAALTAAEKKVRVDLYEQNTDVGKKILASGNGRCNISNTSLTSEDYFGHHPSFVNHALKRFDFKTFTHFCGSIGLLLDIKPDGRVYPLSNEAKSVHEALRREALRRGVRFLLNRPVRHIEKRTAGFIVETEEGTESYDRLLIATGSPAAPQLGGSRSGLRLAESFGHTVVDPYPTLVGLHLQGDLPARMSGIKVDAEVTLHIEGRGNRSVRGDLLFTRYGVSGFAVLDISTEASRALGHGRKVSIGIHLLPEFERQALVSQLGKVAGRVGHLPLSQMLHGLLPKKIVHALLLSLGMDAGNPCSRLGAKDLRRIAAQIADWRFDVTDTHGYKHAETAGGGVSTEEVDAKSMESTIVPGLYFAGEVLDIVGRRGGYNLHFAWASGRVAGEAMAK
ncbi:NAD(P)/FAD-dependent oxidoreductase [Hydrogenimonas sp.]|uniref:NAD(P)/FAD-dependent oxidoreductase n=1 Tax=Hydrogenimonas sp. TaxID=2231112 RepID=UPI00260F2FAB|nr:NAD(P)/FAD-dependent oxidoreductase [Hydrogenimonas sp.]